MGFKAGSIEDFKGSMAEAIETAFEQTWNEVKDIDLPEEGQRDRRILFVAVAQGVLTYLEEHADTGFEVVARGVQQDGNQITSSGTVAYSGAGERAVSVTQDAGEDNRVIVDVASEDVDVNIEVEEAHS